MREILPEETYKKIPSPETLEIYSLGQTVGDLAKILSYPGELGEPFWALKINGRKNPVTSDSNRVIHLKGKSPKGPRLMVQRDSFGWAMLPLLREHCSEITFCRGEIGRTIVEKYKPDVFVFESVGSLVGRIFMPL